MSNLKKNATVLFYRCLYVLLAIVLTVVLFGGLFAFGLFFSKKIRKKIAVANGNLQIIKPDLNKYLYPLYYITILLHCSYGLLDFIMAHDVVPNEYITRRKCFTIDGEENIVSAIKMNKGGIFVTFHYGAWEFIPRALPLIHSVNVYAVYKEQKSRKINNIINGSRKRSNMTIIEKNSKSIGIISRSVVGNNVITVLIDQNQNAEQSVEMYGMSIKPGQGLQRLAVKRGIPVFQIMCTRHWFNPFKFHLKCYDLLCVTAEKREDVNRLAIDMTKTLVNNAKQTINKHPLQWFCIFHKIFVHGRFVK